ncbi:MAG: N-acetylmuramoyl-L-alanine amidase [Candidatus Marithrix sp.]
MYEVRFYKGNYKWRQIQANRDKCVAYIEHHFNATGNNTTGYSVVIVGYNSSNTSKAWGRWYANHIGQEFRVPVAGRGGILVGGFSGRGNGNVKHTNMPAILLEPLFVSNTLQAEIVRSEDGQDRLAKVLADSIIEFFPKGGKIAFSVGHKYKTSRPKDRGASVNGGGSEADYAEIVMEKAKYLLENYEPNAKKPVIEEEDVIDNEIRIIKNGKEIWSNSDLDEDDQIVWDEENRTLYLNTE